MKAAEQSAHMAIPSSWFTRRRITPTMATAASMQGVSSGMSSNPSGCMLPLFDQGMVELWKGRGGSVSLTVVEVVQGLGGESGEHYQGG